MKIKDKMITRNLTPTAGGNNRKIFKLKESRLNVTTKKEETEVV